MFLQFTAMYKITRFVISYLTKDKNVMKKKTQFLLVSLQLSSRYFFTIITALLETFVLCSRVTLCPFKRNHNDIIVYPTVILPDRTLKKWGLSNFAF